MAALRGSMPVFTSQTLVCPQCYSGMGNNAQPMHRLGAMDEATSQASAWHQEGACLRSGR